MKKYGVSSITQIIIRLVVCRKCRTHTHSRTPDINKMIVYRAESSIPAAITAKQFECYATKREKAIENEIERAQ